MAVDFDTDILPFYTTDVATDANYEAPGNFGIPSDFIDGENEQRLLTMIEIVRAYMAKIADHDEAKLFLECATHMLAALPTGAGTTNPFPAANVAAAAQKIALDIFAKRARPPAL